MPIKIEPAIKWSGSKRSVAERIGYLLPEKKYYYEPFVGSGAILPFRKSKHAYAGDVITELIDLWICIRDKPDETISEYKKRWLRLQKEGHTAYYDIRDSFNRIRDPYDFLFLTRTCVNGLIRYNSNGEFNNSLHHTRPGIAPERFEKIVNYWSQITKNVEFRCADYRETLKDIQKESVVFLDPPYGGTKGRYQKKEFNLNEFYVELERLNTKGVPWILTFDGNAGERTYTDCLPRDLYKKRLALPTGNSPFTKLMGSSIDVVIESVYLNFNPQYAVFDAFPKNSFNDCAVLAAKQVEQTCLFS